MFLDSERPWIDRDTTDAYSGHEPGPGATEGIYDELSYKLAMAEMNVLWVAESKERSPR